MAASADETVEHLERINYARQQANAAARESHAKRLAAEHARKELARCVAYWLAPSQDVFNPQGVFA
jgi:hypothetical protein